MGSKGSNGHNSTSAGGPALQVYTKLRFNYTPLSRPTPGETLHPIPSAGGPALNLPREDITAPPPSAPPLENPCTTFPPLSSFPQVNPAFHLLSLDIVHQRFFRPIHRPTFSFLVTMGYQIYTAPSLPPLHHSITHTIMALLQ